MMARTKARPKPAFRSRIPQAPARVLVIVPDSMDGEGFAELALTYELGFERIYRARSPDDAESRQARWAARGIRSQIVTFDAMATMAPEKGNDHD